MRLPVLVSLLLLGAPPTASARIAVEPLRAVLHQADADLGACAATHALPNGRYSVQLVIDAATGKVLDASLRDAPGTVSGPAESCLVAAFTRLAFPYRAPPRAADADSIAGPLRRSRVPRGVRRGPRRPSTIGVQWPFLLVAPGGASHG